MELGDDDGIGMLFHVIVIMQRNSILKFYNILQDHQTQTNKHIITKRVLDYYLEDTVYRKLSFLRSLTLERHRYEILALQILYHSALYVIHLLNEQ